MKTNRKQASVADLSDDEMPNTLERWGADALDERSHAFIRRLRRQGRVPGHYEHPDDGIDVRCVVCGETILYESREYAVDGETRCFDCGVEFHIDNE